MYALHGVAARRGFLDLSRVAIRGWSFGGYLAALAVLRRPDIFHVGVAGAPVQRLPTALQQAVVCSILNEGMLKAVGRLWGRALDE